MRSPLHLVWIAIGGSLLVLLTYPAILMRSHLALRIVLDLLPLVLAFVVSFGAASRLENGIAGQRWHDADIEAARECVGSRGYKCLMFAFVLMYFAVAIWSLIDRTHHASAATILLLPIMTFSRLHGILRPPTKPGERIDWNDAKPIHSEHWGESSMHS